MLRIFFNPVILTLQEQYLTDSFFQDACTSNEDIA